MTAPVGLPPDRLVRAVLANLDQWVEGLEEIANSAEPRRLALHLQLNMMQTRLTLRRLMGEPEEPVPERRDDLE